MCFSICSNVFVSVLFNIVVHAFILAVSMVPVIIIARCFSATNAAMFVSISASKILMRWSAWARLLAALVCSAFNVIAARSWVSVALYLSMLVSVCCFPRALARLVISANI